MSRGIKVTSKLWRGIKKGIAFYACNLRNRHLIVWDILTQPLVVLLAFIMRLDGPELGAAWNGVFDYALLSTVIVPVVFYASGMYRRFWRYASIEEVEIIVIVSLLANLLSAAIYFLILTPLGFVVYVPRSIPLITFFLLVLFAAIPRYAMRLANAFRIRADTGIPAAVSANVLIVGAGDAGNKVLREIYATPRLGYVPIGYVDDDPHKHGLEILGCSVLGVTADIPRLVSEYKVNRIFLAIPSASGEVIRRITQICRTTKAQVLILPGISEIIAGGVSITRLRPVRVEDLLRREPVQIDQAQVRTLLGGHAVLVTGGGGSIGSEICRQVASFNPSRLIILGHGEDSIFNITNELRLSFPNLELAAVIADLRDRPRLDAVLDRWQPDTILHAAAHKHVPLMEVNAPDAVTNNVFGTLNLVESAVAHKVAHLVMISSDKAVNPVNIMGTTKRVAELVVHDAAFRSGLDFMAVRFGNVLGSSGSVVPLFERQIAAGGPVTVTHPEMYRYFMTIPEAVQLVLQAATQGHGGEIFVLDMGEPIRILDLARDMITLSGFEVDRDIKIAITGLRPGEKLFEEICVSDEHYIPSPHHKIFALHSNGDTANAQTSARLQAQLARLGEAAKTEDIAALKVILHEIVPECCLAE
ncbi:MAG: polysaccharide biosynthesis protein [Anaerolineae bacterium]